MKIDIPDNDASRLLDLLANDVVLSRSESKNQEGREKTRLIDLICSQLFKTRKERPALEELLKRIEARIAELGTDSRLDMAIDERLEWQVINQIQDHIKLRGLPTLLVVDYAYHDAIKEAKIVEKWLSEVEIKVIDRQGRTEFYLYSLV